MLVEYRDGLKILTNFFFLVYRSSGGDLPLNLTQVPISGDSSDVNTVNTELVKTIKEEVIS